MNEYLRSSINMPRGSILYLIRFLGAKHFGIPYTCMNQSVLVFEHKKFTFVRLCLVLVASVVVSLTCADNRHYLQLRINLISVSYQSPANCSLYENLNIVCFNPIKREDVVWSTVSHAAVLGYRLLLPCN